MENNSFIKLVNINKIYGNGYHAVYDFSIDINKNEFVVFVGTSGCGKTTTLRMIAGLEEISSGELYINNKFANYLESKDRNISMVFQNYALYPNLTVFENIAYPLHIKHLSKDEIKHKVFEVAKILNLGSYLDSYPKQLSGGQMQRVALGRAIVKEAELFLMDEPLSNLDAKLRVQMRSEIVKLHKSIKATTIYVTHDQIEAMTMADTIVVMNKGYIQQIDSPYNIYANPKNLFVATFIGTPPMNVIPASINDNQIVINDSLSLSLNEEQKNKFNEFYKNKLKEYLFYRELLSSKSFELIEEFVNKSNNVKKAKLLIPEILANLNNEKDNVFNLFRFLFSNLDSLEKDKYNQAIEEISNLYTELHNKINDGINKIYASQTFTKKEETSQDKSKKESFFKRIFKKNSKNINSNTDVLETINEIISKLESNKRIIFVGIRPEDISDKKNDVMLFNNKNETVELLGSELNVYFYINSSKVIAKLITKKLIKPEEPVTLYTSYNSLYYFDAITGENILFKEINY